MAFILRALWSWRNVRLVFVYYEVEECLSTREDCLRCHKPEHHVLEFTLCIVLRKEYSRKREPYRITDRLCDDDDRNSYDSLVRAEPSRRKLSADL